MPRAHLLVIHFPHLSETDMLLYTVAAVLGFAIVMGAYHFNPPAPEADAFQGWLRNYANVMLDLELRDHPAGHIF